jgi:hypothetical protein
MFKKSERIICVDGSPPFILGIPLLFGSSPKEKSIYTVRGYNPGGYLLVEEIVSGPSWHVLGFYEGGWRPSRFRKIVERKTSIEIFTKLLNPTPEKVQESVVMDTLAEIYRACSGGV